MVVKLVDPYESGQLHGFLGGHANTDSHGPELQAGHIVPQNGQHNGGPRAKIENDTRHYVRRAQGDVYVITGPVFTEGNPIDKAQ